MKTRLSLNCHLVNFCSHVSTDILPLHFSDKSLTRAMCYAHGGHTPHAYHNTLEVAHSRFDVQTENHIALTAAQALGGHLVCSMFQH